MERLHDVVVPDSIPYLPQTGAWYFVLTVFVVSCGFAVATYVRYRALNRYRALALERLEDIETRRAFSELPVLLKQTALMFSSRDKVASLTGDAWLEFLDDTYGGDGFAHGPGRTLPELAYGRATTAYVDELVPLVRRWIRHHHV